MINSHSILTLLESRESKGIGFLKLIFFDIATEWMDVPLPPKMYHFVCACVLVHGCVFVCVHLCTHMLALEVREQLRSLFSPTM